MLQVHSASSTYSDGTPSTWSANSITRSLPRSRLVPRRKLAEQDSKWGRGVGDDEAAGRQRRRGGGAPQLLAVAAYPDTELTVERARVERPHRHAGVEQRDQQRVRQQPGAWRSHRAASAP